MNGELGKSIKVLKELKNISFQKRVSVKLSREKMREIKLVSA
jgi:hypothetical protein